MLVIVVLLSQVLWSLQHQSQHPDGSNISGTDGKAIFCSTKRFSIRFTWMLRLANARLEHGRWGHSIKTRVFDGRGANQRRGGWNTTGEDAAAELQTPGEAGLRPPRSPRGPSSKRRLLGPLHKLANVALIWTPSGRICLPP